MATIYKRGNSWTLCWRDSTGLHQISLGGIVKSKAKKILAIKQNEIDAIKHACIPAAIPKAHNAKLTRVSPKPPASGFRGVSASGRGWAAKIVMNYKRYSIGHFDDKISAARAYDHLARKLHGEHARVNFPTEASSNKKDPTLR